MSQGGRDVTVRVTMTVKMSTNIDSLAARVIQL